MTVNNKRTLTARGSTLPANPHERGVTFRLPTTDYARLKGIAIKNYRTMSQEVLLRVMASLDAEEKAR